MKDDPLDEEIRKAKEEAKTLKEQIRKNREAKDDAKLTDLDEVEGTIRKLSIAQQLLGHSGKIYSIHWAQEDPTKLISASQDGKLVMWNANTKHKLKAITLTSTWVMSCGISPSADFVVTGGLENVCSIYNVRTDEISIKNVAKQLHGHTGYVSCCRFVDNTSILTSSGDASALLWDLESQSKKNEFNGHTGGITFCALPERVGSKDRFATASCDKTVKIWDPKSGKCVQTFTTHESDVNSVAFFPNGTAIGTASEDATCRLFDLRADKELMVYENPEIEIGAGTAEFSASGRFLFAGYGNGACVIWDTFSGDVRGQLTHHEKSLHSLGVSADGFALATSSWDTRIAIYSV